MNLFRLKYLLLALMLPVVFACDNLLGVREAEPPEHQQQLHWIPATAPTTLITNMQNAFSYREYETYLNCLTDTLLQGQSFRFNPSTSTQILFPESFDTWSLLNEQTYFQSMLAAVPGDSSFGILISEEEPYIDQGDTIQYQLLYEINIHHTRTGIPVFYTGHMIWYLTKDPSSYWVISRWDDMPLSSEPTWSELKAYF